MKRRKIQKDSEGRSNRDFQAKLLEELKGYKRFVKEKERESYISGGKWKLQHHELRFLLGKETKTRILELWSKYFGKAVQWDKMRYYGRSNTTKSAYIDHFVTKFFSLADEKKRGVEKTNISELKQMDNFLVELNDIAVPRDVILHILSFFHFGRTLLDTVGCVNSSFYLIILGNWKSQVYIDSVKTLYKISLLVLKSLKHFTIDNLATFTKEDLEHLFKNITPDRILSLGFEEKNSLESIKKFCTECGRSNVVFERCKSLYLDPKVEQLFNRSSSDMYFTNWYMYRDSMKKKIDEKSAQKDLLSSILPNVDTFYNPPNILWAGKPCCDIFKNFRKVKKLHVSTENYEFFYPSIEGIVNEPELLEEYSVRFRFHGWSNHGKRNDGTMMDKMKEMLEKLPYLRKAQFKYVLRTPQSRYTPEPQSTPMNPLIDWQFMNKTSQHLEELSVKFNTSEVYVRDIHDPMMYHHRMYRIVLVEEFLVNFPSTLKALSLVDPPYKLLEKLEKVKSLRSLEITFQHHEFQHPAESQRILDGTLEHVFRGGNLQKFDMMIYDRTYGSRSTYVHLLFSKKTQKLRFFGFTKNICRTSLQKSLVECVSKHVNFTNFEELEQRTYSRGMKKLDITAVYINLWYKQPKRVWNGVLEELFGEDEVVEAMEDRDKECGMVDPLKDNKWIKFERRKYVKKE